VTWQIKPNKRNNYISQQIWSHYIVVLENSYLIKSGLSDSQTRSTRHTNCLARRKLTSKFTTAHDNEPVGTIQTASTCCLNPYPANMENMVSS